MVKIFIFKTHSYKMYQINYKIKKIITIILINFFIFLNLSFSVFAKEFDQKIKEIRAEINRDEIKEALQLLGELKIGNESEQEKVDLLFGDIYLKINKPLKAVEYYEKAFMTSDNNVESLSELGLSEAYLRKGNLDKAISHAKRSINIDGDGLRNKIVLAIALTRNGQKEEAIELLEKLYVNYKNNSEVNLAIAGYYSTFENNKKSIDILDKFLKRFPTSIRVMDELGNLYWIEGNKDKALELKSKVYKYHEFNKNKNKLKETKEWILSIDPEFFKKKKVKKIKRKDEEEIQKEEVEKYDRRKKETQFEKFDFAYNFTGSGFIVQSGKYVITNSHVIQGANKIAVRNGLGKISPAKVVAQSKSYDLAILKMKKPFKKYLKPKNFEDPVVGQDVISIGYPMTGYFGNDLPVITQGIISKVYPDNLGIFLTTTDINSGNSGGPIFNLDGNLVGISVATLDKKKIMEETGNIPTSMGIGIKSNMLKEVFKYKKTIPVRNIKYNKSKIYEKMLPMVVFIAVEADPKSKIKN